MNVAVHVALVLTALPLVLRAVSRWTAVKDGGFCPAVAARRRPTVRAPVESLLVIDALGVQKRTTYWSGASTHRFIDKANIAQVIINEGELAVACFHRAEADANARLGITSCRVLFYLAIVVQPPPRAADGAASAVADGARTLVLAFDVRCVTRAPSPSCGNGETLSAMYSTFIHGCRWCDESIAVSVVCCMASPMRPIMTQ